MSYTEILANHSELQTRQENAQTRLQAISEAFSGTEIFDEHRVSIFAAGSLGRGDVGSNSDLDLFVISEISDRDRSKLDDIEILGKLIEINRDLKYPEFSNDGQFFKVYSIEEMKHTLGDPKDDSDNLFTARMLLLLESKPLCNTTLYNEHIKTIVEHYFRDYPDHKAFKPLFLLNDILRYWRTLCLNYERIRNDKNRPWRKKNINLKFSRMLTVFGSVLPLISSPIQSIEDFLELTALTPVERLALGLDGLNDSSLGNSFSTFLDDYEQFLSWKEDKSVEDKMRDPPTKDKSREAAAMFSNFLYDSLTHSNISREFRKFLVI